LTSATHYPPAARGTAAPAGTSTPADAEFCRAMLPRVSRTFAVNIRVLSGAMRDAVRTGYLLCRAADTLEDAWPGDRADIARRFARLREAMAGSAAAAAALAAEAEGAPIAGAARELMVGLPGVWRHWRTLADADRADVAACVDTMADGMGRYAGRMVERLGATAPDAAGPPPVSYLDSEEELHDYCWVVAGCVGVMLTRLFVRRAALPPGGAESLLRLAPAVGEGLQLTNVLLDWPVDIRSGRCHVPASWLAGHGLAPADLVGGPHPGATALARRLEDLARAALDRVPDYLEAIPSRHVRFRQFCAWPALWALASLRHARSVAGFPTGPSRPRLPRAALWRVAARSLLALHGAGSTRRVFAAVRGNA
jgi:farnesyl-diphosphate farnesyltransferase